MDDTPKPITKRQRKSYKIADHPEILEKLYECLWTCKIGKFNPTESLAYINSGQLGYFEQTEQEKQENVRVPVSIGNTTYYRYKNILESPEFKVKEIFKAVREEYVDELIMNSKMYSDLRATCIREMEMEENHYRKARIAKTICEISSYKLSLMDILKNVAERNKIPFPDREMAKKIMNQHETAKT